MPPSSVWPFRRQVADLLAKKSPNGVTSRKTAAGALAKCPPCAVNEWTVGVAKIFSC